MNRRAEAAVRLCEELISLHIVDTLDSSRMLDTRQVRALCAGIAAFEHAAALDYLASEPADIATAALQGEPITIARRPDAVLPPPPRKHSRKQKTEHPWRKRVHPERAKP
jgi:hypothetical protein